MQNLVVTWAIAFILFQGILTEGENIVVIPSTLGDLITGNATSGKTNIYIYNISLDHVPMIDAYINLQKNVSVPYKEFHLSVNAWSYGATVSWSLPLTLFGYPFLFSKKLLCPANYVSDGLKTTPLYVSISSASPVPIPYRLKATYENYGSFIVHPDAEVKAKVSPTHPTIFQIDFGNLTAVDITFTSPDPYCGVALVQNASCPIVTSLDEMKLGDARITFTTDAYLHLEAKDGISSVYVVLLSQPDDNLCGNSSVRDYKLKKHVVAKLSKSSDMQSAPKIPVVILAVVVVIISAITILICVFIVASRARDSHYGNGSLFSENVENVEHSTDILSDLCSGAEQPKPALTILASHPVQLLLLLFVIGSIFVIFLFIYKDRLQENTSFAVVSDKCYYNFRCLRSGAGIVAFNHFSAALLPYLIFGISIGAFTCYRMRCDFRLSLISVEFALLMIFESLSASMFSFCPNRHTAGYENMFIFLALSFLIARRTGFSVESHSLHYVLTFLAFAVLLPTFWLSDNAQSRVIYAFLLVVVLVFYEYCCYRFLSSNDNDVWQLMSFKALAVALYTSAITVCFFSLAFLSNYRILDSTIVYLVVSLIVLSAHKHAFYQNEKLQMDMVTCATLATLFWITAIILLAFKPFDLQVSPAQSRLANQNCLLMNYYDIYDFWHISVALAMFFTWAVEVRYQA